MSSQLHYEREGGLCMEISSEEQKSRAGEFLGTLRTRWTFPFLRAICTQFGEEEEEVVRQFPFGVRFKTVPPVLIRVTHFKLPRINLLKGGVTHFFFPPRRANLFCFQVVLEMTRVARSLCLAEAAPVLSCQSVWLWILYYCQTQSKEGGRETPMENHAALWTHGDMAQRFLLSTNRFSARFAFILTVSLSCTYLCYSILFWRSTIMTTRSYEGKRCPPSKNGGGKKLLGKLDHCASLEVRSALDESAARRGSSDARDQSKASASSDRDDMKLKNMSVTQRYGNKKLPNALIVGVKKGGTRAVLEFIRIHPDVRALGTEPHFFDRNYDRGLEWYRWGKDKHLNSC